MQGEKVRRGNGTGDTRLEGRCAEGRCPGGQMVYQMLDGCRRAGLALRRGLTGAAAIGKTPHRGLISTHQGKARSHRPSSAWTMGILSPSGLKIFGGGWRSEKRKILAAK